MRTRRAPLVAAGGLAVLAAAATIGATSASADPVRTVTFVNHLDSLTPVDVAPAGPSAGDQFYIDSHVVSGDVTGRTSAACVVVKVASGGLRQCEVDFLTPAGIITTRGIQPALAPTTPVRLVVTGGRGQFAGASGGGTLTPTPDGSVVRLRLR
jgi:hypothetical protein